MKHPVIRRLISAAIVSCAPCLATAQTLGTTGAISRTPDGRPDLSGYWQVLRTAAWNIEDHQAQEGVPAGQSVVEGGEIPYQPWALAKRTENYTSRATADPEHKCHLLGVPRIMYTPLPFQIVQTPGQITMFFEYAHAIRYIHMRNTNHPEGPIEWYLGDSRGRWDGDTLVIDVVHFTDQTWLDRAGNFHSETLHVVERFTPMDANHIQYEVTIEDPKVFTRPWKMTMPLYRRLERNFQLLEYECYTFDWEQYYPYPSVAKP